MNTRPDRPSVPIGYLGIHPRGAAHAAAASSTPLPPRDVLIGGVRWQVSAQEYHAPDEPRVRRRPGARVLVVAVTCVRFTTGRLTRITYVTNAAADVLTWADRDLTTLFDVTIPAPAA